MSFIDESRELLDRLWCETISGGSDSASTPLPAEIEAAIVRSINSKSKTYRYVLPTQLLAKLVDVSLDCRALQEGGGLPGSFDARSFCKKVIAPFDAGNHNVLGGSGDPYVSNPLRHPSLAAAIAERPKDLEGLEVLNQVAEYAQANPQSVEQLVRAVLAAIRERLAITHIVYPVPNRISLQQAGELLHRFLGPRTGGVRLQVVSLALFRTIGIEFGLFREVIAENINAADSQTGQAADLECIDEEGHLILAVEVKDRQLALRMVEEKLPRVRERGVRELLFLVQGGTASDESGQIDELIAREFATGQNIYVSEFDEFLKSALTLLREAGRRQLLLTIGECLDAAKADLPHREQWRAALGDI